jgi:hypothetical protein
MLVTFLEFIISVRGSHCFHSPQAPQFPATPLSLHVCRVSQRRLAVRKYPISHALQSPPRPKKLVRLQISFYGHMQRQIHQTNSGLYAEGIAQTASAVWAAWSIRHEKSKETQFNSLECEAHGSNDEVHSFAQRSAM